MKRNQFIQEIFQGIYFSFIEELQDYDEDAGETQPPISEVITEAFQRAARAAEDAAIILETTTTHQEGFWDE